jgi:hypothetical protein
MLNNFYCITIKMPSLKKLSRKSPKKSPRNSPKKLSRKSPRKSPRNSPKKSPKSRVNPFKKHKTTTKKELDVKPRVSTDRKKIMKKDLKYVKPYLRTGGQINGMRPVSPSRVEEVINYILTNNGKIPIENKMAYHKTTTKKKF